jgi:hypothetical protein
MYCSHLSHILAETPDEFSHLLTTASNEFTWALRREVLLLTLFFIGERPTASFSFVNSTPERGDEEHALHASLDALPVESETISEPFGTNFTSISRYYPAAPEEYTLTDFNTQKEYHQFWGDYYEYPQSAIDAFNNDTRLRYYSETADKQLLLDYMRLYNWSKEAVAALPLVPFVPPRDPDGLAEAVELAYHYETTLRTVSDRYELPELRTLIDSVTLDSRFFETNEDIEVKSITRGSTKPQKLSEKD